MSDRALGSTIDLKFTTSVNGVPTALAGSPAVGVYQGGSVTPITTGVSFTGSYAGVTGLNDVSIVASSGNGFAAGNDYSVALTNGTLDGIDVTGFVIGAFSINLGNVAAIDNSTTSAINLGYTTRAIGRGVATSGATTTSVPTSSLSLSGDLSNRTILFDADTATTLLQGAASAILSESGGVLTVSPALPAAPASGDSFSVV